MCRQMIAIIFMIWASISSISAAGQCQLQKIRDDGRTIPYLCLEATFDDVKDISDQADWIQFTLSKLHIPEKAFARFSLRGLAFYKCDMRYIDQKAFEGLHNLERLIFWHSNVHVLPAVWFRHMHNLIHLSMQKSELVYVEPNTFREIPYLQHLDFADNDLNCLPAHALAPLRHLKHVRIEKNPWLCRCHAELVKWMSNKHIDFRAKNMSTVELECMLENIEGLETSILAPGNSEVQPGGTCRGKSLPILSTTSDNVDVINLSGKDISTISEFAFFRFGNTLRSISVSNCSISDIHSEAFVGLPKLEQLILFNNSISTVKAEWFSDLRSLKHLSLARNKIRHIESKVFPFFDKLEFLNLEHNWIECLSTDTFSSMKNLKYVNIARNPWNCNCLDDFRTWLDKQSIRYSASLGQCTIQKSPMMNWNSSFNQSFTSKVTNFTESHNSSTKIQGNFATAYENHNSQFQNEVDHQRTKRSENDAQRVAGREQPRQRPRREPQRNIGQGCQIGYPQRQQPNYICPSTCKRLSTTYSYECLGGTILGLKIVPNTAETITFKNTDLSVLRSDTFSRFGGRLRSLEFWNCEIKTIEPHAFAGLVNLQHLLLNGNNIYEIQATWFESTSNLQRLILTRNSIARIENRVFHLLSNLQYFDVSDNQLNCIGTDSLQHMSKLTTLNVHKNPWSCLCRTKLIQWMDEHHVKYNADIKTEYLDWSCIDQNTTTDSPTPSPPPSPIITPPISGPVCGTGSRCGSIPMSLTHCRCVDGDDISVLRDVSNFAERIEIINTTMIHISADAFIRFSNLKELIFINCSIRDIDPSAFRGLYKLELLLFQNNSISTVRSAWFHNLTALTELNLAGNHITEIESDTFKYLPNLRLLRLNDNDIGCIYTKSLNAAKSLKHITLHNNPWKWRAMEELTQFLTKRQIKFTNFRTYLGQSITCELEWDGSPDKPSGSTDTSVSTINVLCVSIAMLIFTKF